MGAFWLGAVAVLFTAVVHTLPVVDKGVFVITGVKTCREGYGYCILGNDCTVDKEFVNDDQSGHCDGLKKAFTPRAAFVCCMSIENSTIPVTTTSTTTTPPPPPSLEEEDEKSNESNASNPSSQSNEDESKGSGSNESVEIPPSVLNTSSPVQSTTSLTPGVVEEVQTEISVSEHVNVVVGDIVQKVVDEYAEGGSSLGGSSSTTVTSTSTTTTTARTTTSTTETPKLQLNGETCGFKATFYTGAGVLSQSPVYNGVNGVRVDSSRLAAQQTSLVCWTGAIVRSSSSLTLSDPGSFICTGALISEDFLLTTATCVSRLFAQDLSLFKVALGSRHLVHPMNGPTPDAIYKDIVQLIVHEDYNIQGLFKRVNDIALVRLSPTTTLRTDEHLVPKSNSAGQYCTVCLPDGEEDHSGEDCIVTGFSHPTGSAASIDDIVAAGGSIEAPGPGSNQVPSAHDTDGILHEADQRIEYATNCEVQLTNFTVAQNTLLRNDLNIESSKLVCASGKYNMEACFSPRDAGSPLACKTSADQYKLVGVFSSGFHCGTTSSPVLYTDVSKFVPWIRANSKKIDRKSVSVSG